MARVGSIIPTGRYHPSDPVPMDFSVVYHKAQKLVQLIDLEIETARQKARGYGPIANINVHFAQALVDANNDIMRYVESREELTDLLHRMYSGEDVRDDPVAENVHRGARFSKTSYSTNPSDFVRTNMFFQHLETVQVDWNGPATKPGATAPKVGPRNETDGDAVQFAPATKKA